MSFLWKVKFYVSCFWIVVVAKWNYLCMGLSSFLTWTTIKEISAGSGMHQRDIHKDVMRKRQADTVDFPSSNNTDIKKALERVIQTIYSLCISSWLPAPEEMQSQPLYKPISNAILDTCNNIQKKTKHIDNCKMILIITKGLTDHINTFKRHAASTRKINREEEVNFLRQKTKSLLLYLLPDNLKKSDYLMPLLTEVLAITVLEMTINNLAEPAVINQLVVNYLGSQTDGTQGHLDMSILNVSDSSMQTDCQDPKRVKENTTKEEKGVFYRSLTLNNYTEGGATHDESYCQKWKAENWLATITKENGDMFKISVSQNDGLESELWEAKRSMKDLVQVYHKLRQKDPDLEALTSNASASSDTQLSETITDPDAFIVHLVNLIKNDRNQEAAFFLSPFNYEEDRDLFANILLEGEELLDESSLDTPSGSSDDASDGVDYRSLNVEKNKKESASEEDKSASNESLDSGDSDEFQELMGTDPVTKGYDVVGSSPNPDDTKPQDQEQLETQKNKKKTQKALLKALYTLADKIILGGKPVFRFLHSVGKMRTYNEMILQNIDNIFSEEQIVGYLNKICDLIQSTEVPLLVQPEALKRQALELIEKHIADLQMNKFFEKIKKIITPSIMGSIKKSYDTFQDFLANKDTLLKLLGDLSGMITDEEQTSI